VVKFALKTPGRRRANIFGILIFGAVSILLASGCSTTQRSTQSARTATEQLLISEAVTRSLASEAGNLLPIPPGSSVLVDGSGFGGGGPDQALLQQMLIAWLGKQGYLIQTDAGKASHRVNVVVEALGTEFGGNFAGMPPVQSQLIPFSLPELALFKSQYQTGYAKFHMNVYELPGGRLAGSTPSFMADSYYNNYTILFLISFTSTDLPHPAEIGPFRTSPQRQKTPGDG
jgi:hypothetical protein